MAHVTRIAPSPTGMFHVGSARTALFNYLAAKASGGTFILRIDDTDVVRNTPEALEVIYAAINWLGLSYDETFRQSERLHIYENVARGLLTAGLAREDKGAIILCCPIERNFWSDTLCNQPIRISDLDRESINNLVLRRSNGMPTYHFASVVDDMYEGVTWVIRGVDHISNTPKQIAIWDALNKYSKSATPLPIFTHIGLLTQNGKKISKRDNAGSLLTYKENGILPDAMFNWLLRLGWGPRVDDKTTRTISRDRALELFLDGGSMRSSPANIDLQFLESLNRKYKAQAISSAPSCLP